MPQHENFPPVNLKIKSDTETILEQQAEIQRLTAENKKIMELAQREQQQRIESDSEFFKAQEEIQRLTKELELCQILTKIDQTLKP